MKNLPNPNDLEIGDELPNFKTTINRTDIVKYAGAGGDFNPLHHDEEFAKSVGLPSIFAMGLLHGGFLTKVLTDWAGPTSVKRYKIRFIDTVWPNDELSCHAALKSKEIHNSRSLLSFDLSVITQDGRRVLAGEADIELTLQEN